MTLGDQRRHDGDNAVDMVGGLRLHRRLGQPQPRHILIKGLDVAIGNRPVITPFLIGPVDDLVVDIGVVADVGDIVAGVFQITVDDVEDDAARACPIWQ